MDEYPLFQDGQDPRRYFVGRIRRQAQDESVELAEAEREYLLLTERGDDQAAVAMLKTIKGKRFHEFDSCISGLMWRAYKADLAIMPAAKESYSRAIMALANIDKQPNLGIFVNCVALEKSPEERDKKPWWFLILALAFVLWVIYAVLLRRQ
jgi:hypothetical protein